MMPTLIDPAPFRIDVPLADGFALTAYRTTGGSIGLAINHPTRCVLRVLIRERRSTSGTSQFSVVVLDGDPNACTAQ